MRSIRGFLLARLLGGSALVLAAAAALVYVVVLHSLEEQLDKNLADRVRGLASILFQVEDHVEFEFSQELMPEYGLVDRPAYFELWLEDGPLLERSESLRGADLALASAVTAVPSYWDAPLPDGRAGRHVSRRVEVHHVHPEEGPGRPTARRVRIAVAVGREEVQAAGRRVLGWCAGAFLLLVGLIGALSWISVERGLEPARRLARTLDAIETDALPERIDAGPMPAELAPVAEKADALVRRVDVALERERRTAADIAHELRTPISELLTASEVALRGEPDDESARRALRKARDIAWRMGRTVVTLLKLARLEMGSESFQVEELDMSAIVGDARRSLSALEGERRLRVANHVEHGARVRGDDDVLRVVVSNLFSNALYYAPPRGAVECRLEQLEGGWRLSVENEAEDLRPEDLGALSAPFWRKDRSRRGRDRAGLGLALSRALAERAGMELSFTLLDGRLRASLTRLEPPAAIRA